MNTNYTSKNGFSIKNKVIVGITTLVLLGAIGYGAAAYANVWWPFSATTTEQNNPKVNKEKQIPAIAPAQIAKPFVNEKTNILDVSSLIETKEQGDCTLTISNKENSYQFKNSTVGVENNTGCLQWSIGTQSIEKGLYNVTLFFQGKTQSATMEEKITIE